MPGAREILIVKNITNEESGLIGNLLREYGIKNRVIDLSCGEKPGPVEKFAAVIVLGGPDSANDETPKMKNELAFIKKVLDAGIPYFGICLGLQVMVKASGGEVVKSPLKEVGFRDPESKYFNVILTETGRKDPLFDGIDDTFNVFHLHGETVVPAKDMEVLAVGRYCRNQIVKAGPKAYGMQCHLELTSEMFKNWSLEVDDLQKLDIEQLNADYNVLGTEYSANCRKLFRNFLTIAGIL
jgi:GMP synthase-like glutamine amidotransferase